MTTITAAVKSTLARRDADELAALRADLATAAEVTARLTEERDALLRAFPEYGSTEAEGNLRRAAPALLALAERWLHIMGKAGADKCGCRPGDKSYICCRCDVVATIALAKGGTP